MIENGQLYKVKDEYYYYEIDSVNDNYVVYHHVGTIATIPNSGQLRMDVFKWMIEKGEISLHNKTIIHP